MYIDINRVFELKAELNAINKESLYSLEFVQNGEERTAEGRNIESWKLTGLNNVEFILYHFNHIEE